MDVSRQIDGVENLVTQSVSAIVLNPVDSDAIVPAVLSANKAKIPVFTVDVKSRGGVVTAHITSDNVEAGRMAGDYVAKNLPQGSKVGIVDGPPISTFQQRVEGFTKAIQGKLEVGAHQNAMQNTPEAFTAITENLITGNPDLKVILQSMIMQQKQRLRLLRVRDEKMFGLLELMEFRPLSKRLHRTGRSKPPWDSNPV